MINEQTIDFINFKYNWQNPTQKNERKKKNPR